MKDSTILITGGGTGGHISPGLALYEEIKKRNRSVFFLAGKKDRRFSYLNDIAPEDLFFYNAPSLTHNPLKLPGFILFFIVSILKARKLIKSNNVNAVIGMGGYVSAPALLAARMLKVPLYLCEQNSVPGKVTRRFEKYAEKIYGTFSGATDYLNEKEKYVHAGNPIRKKVMTTMSREEARKIFHLGASKKVILAIGGSQGAMKVNELILGLKKTYSDEMKDIGIIWSTGNLSYDRFKEQVHKEIDGGAIYLSPFIEKVGCAYAACDVAISRSGSGVMMELAAMGIPSILIPYPYAAMDHQEMNAEDFSRSGAAIKISNADAVPEKVGPVLLELLKNDRNFGRMKENALRAARPDAAAVIVDDIISRSSLGS